MSGAAVQPFVLTAKDDTAPAFAAVMQHMRALSEQMARIQAQGVRTTEVGLWSRMGAAVGGVRQAMGGVASTVAGLAGSIASLVPPLAALGSVGAVGGIFTLTESVAKAGAEHVNLARAIGLSAAELGRYKFLAKMADVQTESLGIGMTRLGRAVNDAATGKNKNAAQLFAALGISLRDSNGQIKSLSEILPDIFAAFRVNENPTVRLAMAMQLFGKGGRDLIPLFARSREEIETWDREFKDLKWTPPPGAAADLAKYHHEWLKLEYATKTFSRVLGSTLAGTLTPIIGQMTEWVTANRELVATGVRGVVVDIAEALRNVDWAAVKSGFGGIASAVKDMASDLQLLKWVLEAWIAIKGVQVGAAAVATVGGPAMALGGTALLGGSAAQPELNAAVEGFKKYWEERMGDFGPFPYGPGYNPPRGLPGHQFVLPDLLPGLSPSPADPTPSAGLSVRQLLARRLLSLPSNHPDALGGGKVRVEIDITGAPPGSGVATAYEGNVMPPTITFDTGRAFSPMPGL